MRDYDVKEPVPCQTLTVALTVALTLTLTCVMSNLSSSLASALPYTVRIFLLVLSPGLVRRPAANWPAWLERPGGVGVCVCVCVCVSALDDRLYVVIQNVIAYVCL